MKQIELNQGYIALIDDEDYERCMKGAKWGSDIKLHSNGIVRTVYVWRKIRKLNGKRTSQYLHRFILNITDPKIEVDHKNGNGLDNRKENLRKATRQQQSRNMKKTVSYTTSKFKGVYKRKDCNRWCAQSKIKGKHIHLGLFLTEKEAKDAYDTFVLNTFGEFAKRSSI